MVYGAARVCKGINLRGREAYATVPNISPYVISHIMYLNRFSLVFLVF